MELYFSGGDRHQITEVIETRALTISTNELVIPSMILEYSQFHAYVRSKKHN